VAFKERSGALGISALSLLWIRFEVILVSSTLSSYLSDELTAQS
jgi:hypothetical protein